MTITQIEVFIKIAQLKNFTKAGQELGMTQSSVSHSISKLENHLNAKLFDRSKNTVTLTTMGKHVYKHMNEILKNIELIYNQTNKLEKLPPQVFRLGTFQSISISLLPKVIKLFKEIYPQIDFIIFEGTEQEIIQWIKTDKIDLGFITLPSTDFNTTYIIQDELLILLPENHKLSNLKSINTKKLKNEDLIMPIHDCNILMTRETKNILVDVKYRISNFNTIIKMVREELGITIFPKLIIDNSPKGGVISRSFNPPFYRSIGLASKENILDNPLKKIFAEKIKYIIQMNKLDSNSNL